MRHHAPGPAAATGQASDPARRLQAIVEAQREIAAAELDLASVMRLICERTQALTGADGAAVLLPEGDRFRYGAATGFMEARIDAPLTFRSLSGWAFTNNESAFSNDMANDPRVHQRAALDNDMRSMIVVPLRHGGTAIGLLQVSATRPGLFAEEDVQTLDLLSGVLSAAMSHAAQFEALAHFRSVFEESPIGMARAGRSGRIVEANEALARLLGYEPAELVGMSFSEFTVPEDVDETVSRFRGLLDGEYGTYRIEKRYRRRDGETIWINGTTTVVDRDATGRPTFVIAMIEDVTERKRAELALRESEDRQARIAETQAEIAAAGLDLDAAMQLVADRSLTLTAAEGVVIGLVEDDEIVWVASSGEAGVPRGTRIPAPTSMSIEAIRTGRPVLLTDPDDPRFYRPLTEPRGISSMAAVPLFRGGKPVGVLLAAGTDAEHPLSDDDVRTLDLLSVVLSAAMSRAAELESERRRVEALSQFEATWRASRIGIELISLDGRIIAANPAMDEVYGYTLEEYAAMYVSDFTHPDDRSEVARRFFRLVNGQYEGDSCRIEARFFHKSGELVWVSGAMALVRDQDGTPLYVLGMAENVTERKRTELALAESNRRLAAIAETQAEIAAAGVDLDAAMQLVAERAAALTGAGGAAVVLLEEGELVTRAASGAAKAARARRGPADTSLTAEAVRSGRSQLARERSDARLDSSAAQELGVESIATAPLFRGGKPVGAITAITTDAEPPLGEDDVRTLDLLAGVLSAALSRSAELEAERRHVEALSRFEALYKDSPMGIGLLALDGTWIETNDAFDEITGRTDDERRGIPVADHTHPDDVDAVVTEFERMLRGEQDSYKLEVRHFHKDGSIVWARSQTSLVRGADGEPRFAVVTAENVTDRKLTEIALQEKTERLARIVETQGELGAISVGTDYAVEVVAARAFELIEPTEAIVSLVDGDDLVVRLALGSADDMVEARRPLAESLTQRALSDGRPLLVEHLAQPEPPYPHLVERLGDGSAICVPLYHAGRALGSLLVTAQEDARRLTEDDRQTLELLAVVLASAISRATEREALARFAAVYDDSPVGIGLLGLDRRWLDVNQAMLDITGRTRAELLQLSPGDYTHPDDAAANADSWRRLVAGEIDSYEIEAARYIRKSGDTVWARSKLKMMRDQHGEPRFVLVMSIDVTQQKDAEVALRASAERLARVVETQTEAAALGSDVDAVLRLTLERVLELTRAQGASANFVDGDELVTRANVGTAADGPGDRRPLPNTITAAAIAAGSAILVEDARNDERLYRPLVERTGERSHICVPVYGGDEYVGSLSIHTGSEHAPLDEEDLRTAELLGLVLSSTLSRSSQIETLTRFETIFRDAPLGIAVVDFDSRFVDVNPAFCAIDGYDRDEHRGMPVADNMHPDDRDAALAAAQHGDSAVGGELRIVRKDGETVWIQSSFTPLGDRERGFAILMCHDVTQRKLAELALRENTARLARVLDTQTQIAAATLDLDGVMRLIVERSQALTRGTGAMVDLLDGDDLVTRAATGTAAATLGNRRPAADSVETLRSGRALLIEQAEDDPRLYRPLADSLGVRSLVCIPLFKGGRPAGALTVVSDSRDARLGEQDRQTLELLGVVLSAAISRAAEFEAERQRVETLTRYETIYAGAPWGITLLDLAGRPIEMNEAACAIVGRPLEELRQMFVVDYTHPDDVEKSIVEFRRLLQGEIDSYRFEHRLLRADGTPVWVDSSVSLLHDADGKPYAALSLAQDIHQRKQTEEQLRQSQKIEAIGQLSAGIAHDFNNLLMGVLGYAGLARGEVEPASRAAEYLDKIEKTGHRAASLTKQLLAFGRRQTLQPRPLDLNELISETLSMLERVLGEHIEMVPRLAPCLPSLRADPTQLQQVLFNLALNARDAMPGGGALTIATSRVDVDEEGVSSALELEPGTYIVLTVEDTGVGMPAAVRERIFEPFFTTKGVGEGTGLGLPSVYGIVKQSRGDIEVASEPGLGTSFRIYLPAAEDVPPRRARPAGTAPRVLLVEEAQVVRDLVETLLDEHGYEVVVADDAAAAVRLAQEGAPFDVLLTDLVLARTSGADLAARVQEHQPTVRVLYMSAYEPDQRIDRDSVIPKPFRNVDLLEKLAATVGDEAGV